jgi:hypothetical protein
MRPIFLALSLAAAAPVPCGRGAAAAETCFADWSIAARIVREQGLTSVEKLAEFAQAKGVGPIVRTMLCEANGSFFDKLITREPMGQVKTFTVDAREPFVR